MRALRIVGALVALALAALVAYETLDAGGDSAAWQAASTVFAVLSVATLLTLALIGVRPGDPPRTIAVLLAVSAPLLLVLWFCAMLFYTSA
jgi:hypothetical protein